MNIWVELAISLYFGRTIGDALTVRRKRREARAAKLEYNACQIFESVTDETKPFWVQEQNRERYRERQRELKMRYPAAIVPAPDSQYFAQVREEDRDEIASLKADWKYWLGGLAFALLIYGVIHIAGIVWHSIF